MDTVTPEAVVGALNKLVEENKALKGQLAQRDARIAALEDELARRVPISMVGGGDHKDHLTPIMSPENAFFNSAPEPLAAVALVPTSCASAIASHMSARKATNLGHGYHILRNNYESNQQTVALCLSGPRKRRSNAHRVQLTTSKQRNAKVEKNFKCDYPECDSKYAKQSHLNQHRRRKQHFERMSNAITF